MRLLKIFLWIIFFSICYLNTNALNIEINTDKNNLSVWEVFDLDIEIEWNVSSDFNLWEIKWLENFYIVNRSQSQSSASKIVVLNWQTQRESKTIYNIHYTLQANKKWDFVIWPISLTGSWSNISTSPVNINVEWSGLLWSKKPKNIDNNQSNNDFDLFFEDEKVTDNNIIIDTNKKSYLDDIIVTIKNIFFIILAFVPIFLLFYYFQNKDKINLKIKESKFWNKFNNLRIDELKETIFNTKEDKEKQNYKQEGIIKVEDVKEDIYPSKYDKDFLSKLEEIFRNKLKRKYKLENIKNKTYVDILSEVENIKFYDKEKIKMLSNLFNKAKYSKIWVDKEELLELVKTIK